MLHKFHIQQSKLQPLLDTIRTTVLNLHNTNWINAHHTHHTPHGNNSRRDPIDLFLDRFDRKFRCLALSIFFFRIDLDYFAERITEFFDQDAFDSHFHCHGGGSAGSACSLEQKVDVSRFGVHFRDGDISPVGDEIWAYFIQNSIDIFNCQFQWFSIVKSRLVDGVVNSRFKGRHDLSLDSTTAKGDDIGQTSIVEKKRSRRRRRRGHGRS
mmetsp:Transcript_29228/g.62154  ORF Transcript_29228/g.62154 Transcript_29228/m.62154 type:complete len:211 (+) Transcript_29228:123-755(+)